MDQCEAFAKARSIEDVSNLKMHVSNIMLAYDTYNLGSISSFKPLVHKKFGPFDYKQHCSPEVLGAITQACTEEERREFAQKFAEENSINIKLFGPKYEIPKEMPVPIIPNHDPGYIPGYMPSHQSNEIPGYS